MYSKATIAGHPIHPMLIPFPIALYTITVGALITFAATRDPFWFQVAVYANLAGLAMAVLAVIPGVIDLFVGVPAGSHARDTGLKHLALNIVANGLFAISGFMLWVTWRDGPPARGAGFFDGSTPLVFAAIGELALIGAGIFGWRLIQRHHVGVEPVVPHTQPPRYAEDFDEDDDTSPFGVGHLGDRTRDDRATRYPHH